MVNNGMARSARGVVLAATALVVVLLATACAGSVPGGGGGELAIAGYKDTSGQIQNIIDTWNNGHPAAQARYIELSTAADAQHQQLAQDFLARSSTYDMVITDDTSISEFAAKKWLVPLPEQQFPLDQMYPASVQAGMYRNHLYAVPYTASTVILYYRSDLVPNPPTTWAQLIEDCTIARARNIGCYAGQYAQYEGLTVSFLSAVASAGGAILSPDGQHVVVDSPQAEKGLDFLVNGLTEGYIPKAALTYQEVDSQRAFQQGKLLFMVDYPFVYAEANTPGPDTTVAGKFGVSAIPGLNGPGVVSAGEHLIGVSTFSRHQGDALAFVTFFTSQANARQLLIKVGDAPVWKQLYHDPALIKKFPFLPVVSTELTTAVTRPQSKDYIELTQVIQQNVYGALQGSASPSAALRTMASQLREVIVGD